MKPETTENTTYTLLKHEKKSPPKIIIGRTAIKWIEAMADLHSEEIGFYGIVDERADDTYFIRDIFYPKHSEAHATTCEISEEGEYGIMSWLENKGRGDDIPKIRFWGHSHCNMGVSPSGQDESQSLEKMEQNKTYFIRAICNKKGSMSISFFDFDNQIKFDSIKWTIEEDENLERLQEENLNLIASVITSEEMDSKSKLDEIRNISNSDPTIECIRAKIKELKKVNLPEKKYTKTVGVHNGYNKKSGQMQQHFGNIKRHNGKRHSDNFQENMFDINDYMNDPRYVDGINEELNGTSADEYGDGYGEDKHNDLILSDQEIDGILEEFDKK